MDEEWIMVRVKRSTHAWLDATRKSLQLAADMGLKELEYDSRDRVSIDQVIRELLYMRARHSERRRRAAARKRARAKNGVLTYADVGPAEETDGTAQDLVHQVREIAPAGTSDTIEVD